MAVLVAVAIPTVSAITGTAKKNVADTNAQTIESMIKLKEAEIVNNENGVSASLTEADITEAIVEAKLGITDGIFYYNPNTGSCVSSLSQASAGAADITITFNKAAGTVKVGNEDAVSLDSTPESEA